MDMKRVSTAAAVPLPDPGHDAQRLISKMTAKDKVQAFLLSFEWTAVWEVWWRIECSNLLPHCLREAQLAYHTLDEEEALEYD